MSDRRILVVDDEPDMVENCTRLLRRAGHRVMGTTDPERALALLESERPDLLLTDVKMPGIDGMELMRRAHELDPALPVIVVTAFATIEAAVAAIKAGAFDYLPKTFTADQLTVAVERARSSRTSTRVRPRAFSAAANSHSRSRAETPSLSLTWSGSTQ